MPSRNDNGHKLDSEALDKNIRQLCASGYQAYDQNNHREALRLFYQAWLALPKPQSQYPQSTWILSSIGDCYFRLKQYQQGCESLKSALHCPDGEKNPFIHMRLGQCLFELQQLDGARKHLTKARSIGGDQILLQEPVKYRFAAKDSPA